MSKIIYRWEYPDVILPQSTNNTAVVVVATGERGESLFKRWGNSSETYAQYIGADFIKIGGPSKNPNFPWMDKFGLHRVLEQYDRVIYIDADVEVMPGAPNLFEVIPDCCFGAADERLYYYHDNIDAGIKRVEEIGAEYEFNFYKPSRYLSTSIMVASHQHRPLFTLPTIPFLKHPCYEQDLIHARLLHFGYPTIYMGPEIQYIHGWGGHSKEHTKFHHYPGVL